MHTIPVDWCLKYLIAGTGAIVGAGRLMGFFGEIENEEIYDPFLGK